MRAPALVAGVFAILVIGFAAEGVSATALNRVLRHHSNRLVLGSERAGAMTGRVVRSGTASYRVLQLLSAGPDDYDLTHKDHKFDPNHSVLGAGGNGVVYKAQRLTGDKGFVALKFMKIKSDAEFETAQQIEILSQKSSAVCAEYFPKMYEKFDFPAHPTHKHVHAMELLEGVSLKSAIAAGAFGEEKRNGPTNSDDFKRIDKVWTRLRDAVQCLHHISAIHTDLKPEVWHDMIYMTASECE